MKKLFALALMLIVFCVGNTSTVPVKALPGVLNVGPGQSFATITAALAVAVPGDVIHVWNNPNPYVESPVINVPNIKIIGESLAMNIQPSGPGPCFAIYAPGVTIMNCYIMGFEEPSSTGIFISPTSMQCKIWNNWIVSFDYGIFIYESPGNEIIGNTIIWCRCVPSPPPICSTGIYLHGPSTSNNEIRGNQIGFRDVFGNWYAVGTDVASWNTITLNNIEWNPAHSAPPPQVFVVPGDTNYWDSWQTGLAKGNWWDDYWPKPPYVIDQWNVDAFCSPLPYNWAAMPWDLNRDGKCDIKDVATASVAYGTTWSNLKWNPAADVVRDSKIDIKDIATIAIKFGWTIP